ncbi:MAG: diadenylate cyclase CdaA [Bacteroidota bacterium]|nr:diadenylate cyclase CdaA [Bacteroidota bacterium]
MIVLFLSIRFLDIIDILLFAFLLYQVYKMIKGSYAIKIIVGVLAVYLFWYLVKALNMHLISKVLGQFIGVGVIALIIVFQPELRKGFMLLGARYFTQERFPFISKFLTDNTEGWSVKVKEIVTACRTMSLTKTGALIVFQRKIPLAGSLSIKDVLNADTSSRLLVNIFFKNSPLHDGAVIINGNKIYAARCVLPISEKQLPENLGMRHRAAMGISEITDAVVVTVSEETGSISIIKGGEISYGINAKELQKQLEELFEMENKEKSVFENLFSEKK